MARKMTSGSGRNYVLSVPGARPCTCNLKKKLHQSFISKPKHESRSK